MRQLPRASPASPAQRQHRQQLLLLLQREQGLQRNLRSRMRPAAQLPRYVSLRALHRSRALTIHLYIRINYTKSC